MTSFNTGRQAENVAAEHLKKLGFKILEQNWRTRFCEIDIVAQRNGTIYFVEVKYRINNMQGSGLDYITPQKLRQMRYAAEFWVSKHSWDGDYNLAAIEVAGTDFRVTEFVDWL